MSTSTKEATSPFTERINRIEISATLAAAAEAEKMKAAGVDMVDLTAGEPHFATPQHIKDAAIAAIKADFTKYTNVGGTVELRDAIINRHAQDFGSSYRREECMASTGGKQALFNAVQVLVDHGDDVIVPVPYWVSFKDIVRYAGGNCVYVDTDEADGFRLTASMIERALTPRTKAIILNSPSNPSGAVMDPDDAAGIARLAHERGIYILADECYVYLNYTGRTSSVGSVPQARENVVILGSMSKTYAMTGWRLGYALGPEPIIKAMQKLQGQSTSNPTSIVQKAAVAAVSGPQTCVEEFKADYIKLRNLIVGGLNDIPGVKCTMPEGAFYAYPNVSSFIGRGGVKSTAELVTRLTREAHVAVVPGEGFGTKEHFRISYATSAEQLKRGLERMRNFFAKL